MLDDQKRSEIENKVKAALAKFSKNFVTGFASATVEKSLADAAGDGDDGPDFQLESPPDDVGTEPIKMGMLSKRGAVRKNWKMRYFVVRPDYVIDYYESQEKYESGAAKPKGSVNLAGYRVVTSPNQRKMDALQAKFKVLGITEPVPEYTKYPEFMIECFRNNQRRWLIQCKDAAEFDEWSEMLTTCCRKAKGRTETDPVIISAFDKAFAALRGSLNVPAWNKYDGGETEMLGELLSDDIVRNDLKPVFDKVEGAPKIKMMVVGKIEDVVRSIVGGIVGAGWKAARVGIDKAKPKIEETAAKGLGPVAEAKAKVEATVTEKTTAKIEPIREKVLQPVADKIVGVAVQPVAAAFKKVAPVVAAKTKEYIEAVKAKANDLTAGKKKLANAHNNRSVMGPVFESLKDIVNKAKEALKALPGDAADLLEKIVAVIVEWIGKVEDAIKSLFRNAAYTFTKRTEEKAADKSVEAVEAEVDAEVQEKTKHDAKVALTQQLEGLLTSVLDASLKAKALEACAPIISPLDSLIPDPVKDFISVEGVFDDVLGSVVESTVNKTIEPAMASVDL
eukprot:m.476829 g.476829  ORF g.476829 m.476829 type:complete len:563 (-) comp20666_c0_seq1:150-1838(-)